MNLQEMTDRELEAYAEDLRRQLRIEWCATLIMQALDRVEREQTRPERLAAKVAAAPAGLIVVRCIL